MLKFSPATSPLEPTAGDVICISVVEIAVPTKAEPCKPIVPLSAT